MPDISSLIATALVAFALWYVIVRLAKGIATVTVYEYQAGLRYRNGVFVGQLGPGRYGTFWPGTTILIVDLREHLLTVPGQEMLTSDNLVVKASLAVRHRTADARLKTISATDTMALLYSDVQVALRQAIAARTLEALLAERGGIAQEITSEVATKAAARGTTIVAVEVRDIMLAGETKRAYADIFRAKKEGEASLERARGETAALRNLANGARLLKDNPALFNLRLLQTLSTSAAKGATVVINATGERIVASGENDTNGPKVE